MHISPLDIRKQPFRKSLMGFDPDEVNSFLEMVAAEFESLIRQNSDLATEAKLLGEKIDQYSKIEKVLNLTLITAQKATDEARVNAQKEAELILKDAQIRADGYEDESRRRVRQLENDLMTLRNQRDHFLSRFKSVLKTQLDLLETVSQDLKDVENKKAATGRPETMDEVSALPDLAAEDVDQIVV